MIYRVFIFLILIANPIQAQIFPELEGEALITALRDNYTPDNILDYDNARDTLYHHFALNNNDSLSCVYTDFTIWLNPTADPSTDAYEKGINAEHMWPQSKGASEGNARSNLHHIMPCKDNVNSSRGNTPYSDIIDSRVDRWYYRDMTLTSPPGSDIDLWSEKENNYGGWFEPRESVKGDVARAMLYFYTIYQEHADAADPNFFELQRETFLAWNDADPVDDFELWKTWLIADYQDDLPNPFVVDESLARRAYEGENSIEHSPAELSQLITLSPNYPNPFKNMTRFHFNLPYNCTGSFKVWNVLGQPVYQAKFYRPTGAHNFDFKPKDDLPSGIYMYQLKFNGETDNGDSFLWSSGVSKLILIK